MHPCDSLTISTTMVMNGTPEAANTLKLNLKILNTQAFNTRSH